MGGDYLHSPDPLWLGLKARRRTPPRENPAPFGQPRERMDGGGRRERRTAGRDLAGFGRKQQAPRGACEPRYPRNTKSLHSM